MPEERYEVAIGEKHIMLPWWVKYAAVLINMCRIGEDGKTGYERRRGRAWKKALPVFGECIWWMRPESAREKKLERRWENGIYLGVRRESTEIIVGNAKGVVKTRTFTVRPEGQRWQNSKECHGNPSLEEEGLRSSQP